MKKRLDEKLYPDVNDRWDDKIFRNIILEHIDENAKLLDLGAGSGRIPEMNFKDKVEVVYGIDPDPDIKQNSYLDNAAVGNGESLPYEENTFDVVISDNVLEHLVNPEKVFKEVHRVLKPGGYYLFKTPNKYHYMPLIARLTPHFFHEWINERRGRESKDTFPTQYLANSRSDNAEN
jgi:ubiquinone/menaquinone biosynthesis C-methylase UbiE